MGRCIEEISLDLQDYQEGGTVFKRKAVRGIVRRGEKYLVIHGKYGDYKFPGGGMKEGEELQDTLIREVQEETGFKVIPGSIKDYLLVHEKRRGEPEDLLEMDSWYYFCQVEENAGERCLDEYEQEYDYQVSWMALPEIIQKNESVDNFTHIPWVVRETLVMRKLYQMRVTPASIGGE